MHGNRLNITDAPFELEAILSRARACKREFETREVDPTPYLGIKCTDAPFDLGIADSTQGDCGRCVVCWLITRKGQEIVDHTRIPFSHGHVTTKQSHDLFVLALHEQYDYELTSDFCFLLIPVSDQGVGMLEFAEARDLYLRETQPPQECKNVHLE